MICDGGDGSGLSTGTETFDTTKYSKLYSFLGTDKVPDLRECVLVGVGTNSTFTITNHDTYTVGEFKDDQLQDHKHKTHSSKSDQASGSAFWFASINGSTDSGLVSTGYRVGTTTHGKQVGVNYLIKAL